MDIGWCEHEGAEAGSSGVCPGTWSKSFPILPGLSPESLGWRQRDEEEMALKYENGLARKRSR